MKAVRIPSMSLLLLVAVGSTGCDSIFGPDPEPASIEIRASRSTLDVPGDTLVLEAVVRADDGSRISSPSVTWESRAPDVATVDQTGFLSAVANGTAVVTARSGTVEDSLEITVDAPIACAPVGDLVVPDTLAGAVEDGDCQVLNSTGDFWRLTLDREMEVTIELRSSELDAILVLLDHQGDVIEIDDDGGIGLNSRIHRVLPAATYYLFATSYFPDERGPYFISAFEGGYPSPCPATASIALPGSAAGTVSAGSCHHNGFYVDVWRLRVPTDTTVVVQVGSNQFVPFIAVADTLGRIFDSSHLGPGTDALIEIGLSAGSYDLWIGDATMRQRSGAYTLSTRFGPSLVECGTEGVIAAGDTVSGELSPDSCYIFDGAADAWDLELADSVTLHISLETDRLSPAILVSDSTGALTHVIQNNESSAAGEVSLEPGAYRVWAWAANDRYGGYSLAVEELPAAAWSPASEPAREPTLGVPATRRPAIWERPDATTEGAAARQAPSKKDGRFRHGGAPDRWP